MVRVHDHIVELRLARELGDRVFEPSLELRSWLGPSSNQSLTQGRDIRWLEEDQHGLRHDGPDTARALDVDLDERILAARNRVGHLRPRGPIKVAGQRRDARVLDEGAALHKSLKFRLAIKEVINSITLAVPRLAGCGRDRVVDIRFPEPELLHQRGLTRAGGSGEDEEHSLPH